jgi:hypothetical protein
MPRVPEAAVGLVMTGAMADEAIVKVTVVVLVPAEFVAVIVTT